ncbi:MAG: hypothetical protein ACJA1L_002894 [Paracoccaceae bacterium]|jgi:hypothetical protein
MADLPADADTGLADPDAHQRPIDLGSVVARIPAGLILVAVCSLEEVVYAAQIQR